MGHLTWGLMVDEIKQKFPNAYCGNNYIDFGRVTVNNFPGDCGALLVRGLNNGDVQSLKDAEKYASLSGFSKMFGTIVCEKKYADAALETMKALGWRCISKGNSNRNPEKRDYVMFKRINCSYKGY